MKRFLFMVFLILLLSSPAWTDQSNVVDNTNVMGMSSSNDGNKQELNLISNGPEKVDYYQFGAVTIEAPLIQAPSTVFDREEGWELITKFSVINPDTLYNKEKLREILAEHRDVVQLFNGFQDTSINRPIYSIVRPSKGAVHLLTIKLTAPPNGMWEEAFKRATSLGYHLTNSHFVLPKMRKSYINKAASSGGNIPISSTGPIGDVAVSLAASGQSSTSGVRPFEQFDVKLEFYSNNIINHNDMLMNAGIVFPSMDSVEKFYMLYFTDDSLTLSKAAHTHLKNAAREIRKSWENGSSIQVIGIGQSGQIDAAAIVSEDVLDKIGSYLHYDGFEDDDISDRLGSPLAMSAYSLPMMKMLEERNAIAAVQINIIRKEVKE